MASEVIKLNLIPSGEMPTYHCSQFDNGRLILIDLFNGEDEYSLPAGYTAELHTRKMDNNIVTLATTSVSSNHLTFTSTEQLTACAGNNLSEVSIKDASDYVVGTLNFWLYVEKDPLQGGLTSTSAIHDLTDQIEEITTEIVGENYYNKSETDDFLDLKADKSTTYTKTEVNTLLNSKADASSVYTKSETNTLLSTKADASDVYTKSQVETKLAAKADTDDVYTKSETDTLLSAKADANGVYNKVEVDAMVDDLEDAIDLKADAATTYTKTEVDTALALKANAADVYTKTEVDNIILDIMPVDTTSGAIATFNTELDASLVNVSCEVVATGGGGTPTTPIPIVGYSQAVITANSTPITVSFGQTVYGGVLDVTRGKLTVTHGIVDLGDLNWNYQADQLRFATQGLYNLIKPLASHNDVVNAICTDYVPTDYNTLTASKPDNSFAEYITGQYFYVIDKRYTDAAVFKSAVAGVKLVYELATPFDIDLTPVQINAIVGSNSVSSDTNGNTTVQFKDSIQHYIDTHTGG